MRRTNYLSITALGAMICLIGGTGLFAALTDSARTGPSSIDSAPLAGSADIQLASAVLVDGEIRCTEPFSEDLSSPVFEADDVTWGGYNSTAYFCVRNVGSQPVDVSVTVDELADIDFACTGDEALHGDVTCGGDQVGELAEVLSVAYDVGCPGQFAGAAQIGNHSIVPLATIRPEALDPQGWTTCVTVNLFWNWVPDPDYAQLAQSDRATWRFKFIAES